jgi:hypothetical protein
MLITYACMHLVVTATLRHVHQTTGTKQERASVQMRNKISQLDS